MRTDQTATDAPSDGDGPAIEGQILDLLHKRLPPAAFVTEIAALVRPSSAMESLESALQALDHQGKIFIADHPAPDVHLQSIDLRIAACFSDDGQESSALDAAESVWNGWLRAFLATHRCE